MRAKRTWLLVGALCVLTVLAAIPWVVFRYQRHQKDLIACRKAFAELLIERPKYDFREPKVADSDRFSLADEVRNVARACAEPAVLDRTLRDSDVAAIVGQGRLRADELGDLIRTQIEQGENSAIVRVWFEGPNPKDAAVLTNALADAVEVEMKDRQLRDLRAALDALKEKKDKEAARRAELTSQMHQVNRRIESSSHVDADLTRERLRERLIDAVVELTMQRFERVSEKVALEGARDITVGALAILADGDPPGTAALSSNPQPSNFANGVDAELAKLDAKIEYFKEAIERLRQESSSGSLLRISAAELKNELDQSSARVKSLADAIWSRTLLIEKGRPLLSVYRRAEAPRSE